VHKEAPSVAPDKIPVDDTPTTIQEENPVFFISSRTSAELSLTTPPECCCNCGARGELEMAETPLTRVRYFFIFGTELTLTEFFPYCAGCVKTAKRVRQGWLAKVLAACMVSAATFLALVIAAESLPKILSTHLFAGSVLIGFLLTVAYFYVQEWGRKGRTHYQPVSLVDADIEEGLLKKLKLRFYNAEYAAVFQNANLELVSLRRLEIVAKA